MPEIGGVSDRPNFPSTGGLKTSTVSELQGAIVKFEESVNKLKTKVADAQSTKEAMLQGVALLEKITNMVITNIHAYEANKGKVRDKSGLTNTLFNGLLPIINAPADERGAATMEFVINFLGSLEK